MNNYLSYERNLMKRGMNLFAGKNLKLNPARSMKLSEIKPESLSELNQNSSLESPGMGVRNARNFPIGLEKIIDV